MNIPADLKYVSSHEWVRIEGDHAVIGVTDFAQSQLGDVTFVELPSVGDSFEKDQEMGSVESVKAASELYCPVKGTVVEVNTELENSPELINSAPYAEGWMIRVKLDGEPEGLLSSSEYTQVVQG